MAAEFWVAVADSNTSRSVVSSPIYR